MQSPCSHVCAIDPATGFCMGCGRTLAEIGDWMSYSDDERRRLMAVLPSRLFDGAQQQATPSSLRAERHS